MTLWRSCILFLLLSVIVGLVKFTVDTPRTGLLIDATFVAAVAGFLVCGIGHLGRRLASLAKEDAAEPDDRHRSSPPRAD